MKFQFSTTLENISVPGVDATVGRVDVSVSMEMEDGSYKEIIELVYSQMAEMLGGSMSIKSSDDETPFP